MYPENISILEELNKKGLFERIIIYFIAVLLLPIITIFYFTVYITDMIFQLLLAGVYVWWDIAKEAKRICRKWIDV